VESKLLLISEVVVELEVGMYGDLQHPDPIANIKKSIDKGEDRPSIAWEPQKEDAAKPITHLGNENAARRRKRTTYQGSTRE
jgi:hypothetical protein